MPDPTASKSNTAGFVLAALIIGGTVLVAKKMDQPPVIVVPPQPGPQPDPGPSPDVSVDMVRLGRQAVTDATLGEARNLETAADAIDAGTYRTLDEVHESLGKVKEKTDTEAYRPPNDELAKLTDSDMAKLARMLRDIAKGKRQALSSGKQQIVKVSKIGDTTIYDAMVKLKQLYDDNWQNGKTPVVVVDQYGEKKRIKDIQFDAFKENILITFED